jgi:hypothetical protein
VSTTRVNSRDADRLVLAQVRLLRTLLAPKPRIGECGAAPVTRASGKTKTWVPLGRHRAEQRLTV